MNRPYLDDSIILKHNMREAIEDYYFKLGKYCNELEKENKQLKEDYETEINNLKEQLAKERRQSARLYKKIKELIDGTR